MFDALAPYKLLIEAGLILALLGSISVYSYKSGYSHATDKANAAQEKVVQTANAAVIAKNAEVAKINANLAQITQKMELNTHEYTKQIELDRIALTHTRRMSDPYAKPTHDCKLPSNASAAQPTTDSPAPAELSEQLTEFLERQSYEADQVAAYANVCHDWAIGLTTIKQ